MKCMLCEQYFAYEVSFKSLFKVNEICNECMSIYQPKLQFEVIPVDNGLLYYYYLYDEISLNKKQEEYLLKHFKILLHSLRDISYNIAIILTVENLEEVKESISLIIGFKQIVFMSLSRMNFDDCVVFY